MWDVGWTGNMTGIIAMRNVFKTLLDDEK